MMKRSRTFPAWVVAGLGACALLACGGGGSDNNGMDYQATSLVTDTTGGPYTSGNTDPNLINGWGVAFNPQGFVWVAATETSKSTLYDGNGVPQSLVVSIPSGTAGTGNPTGIVYNGSANFKVSNGTVTEASPFIFAGEAGTISGWSPTVDATNSITVFDGGADGTSYRGLALAADHLFATDFHNAKVDVFDASFAKVTVAGGFTDPDLPAGYAPFGIQAIGDLLYVTFALQDALAADEEVGAGLGLVDVFDTDGTLVKRLVTTGGPLNAPWGMALAPSNFGRFSGALLVGNFGDGKINAFDVDTGELLGTVSERNGTPITIDGLWGIAFGNGINSQPTNTLFFAAGPQDETHGLYGRIDVN
jgi:uncharacterized protein (TIGR03118 family)